MSTAQIIHRYVKNRKDKEPRKIIERNCRLYADYRSPKEKPFIVPLVAKYQISSSRIFQIIDHVERGGLPKKIKRMTDARLLKKRRCAIERLRSRRGRAEEERRKKISSGKGG